jgi:hypothetical protein
MAANPNGQRRQNTEPHCCGRCVHFGNAPAAIEAAFKGLTAMSSGHASVRSHDGLCDLHGLYLSYRDCCADFAEPHGTAGYSLNRRGRRDD